AADRAGGDTRALGVAERPGGHGVAVAGGGDGTVGRGGRRRPGRRRRGATAGGGQRHTPGLTDRGTAGRHYARAASRSRANSSARVVGVQCALSPLGLGSTHTRVSPIVRSCGPTRAARSSNATR